MSPIEAVSGSKYKANQLTAGSPVLGIRGNLRNLYEEFFNYLTTFSLFRPTEKSGRIGRRAFLGGLAVGGILSAAAGSSTLRQVLKCEDGTYSPRRRLFLERYNINLHGFPDDIEGDQVALLSNLEHTFLIAKQLGLNLTRETNHYIVSPRLRDQSFMQQLKTVTTKMTGSARIRSGNANGDLYTFPGSYKYPNAPNAGLNEKQLHVDTLHELVHLKTKTTPGLLRDWIERCGTDEQGRSIYQNDSKSLDSSFHYPNTANPKNTDEYLKDGLIVPEAGYSAYEDIAVFISEILLRPDYYVRLLLTNPKLMKRVHLAMEYGLLPADFLEAMTLLIEFPESKNVNPINERKKRKETQNIFARIHAFHDKFPQSIFVPKFRLHIAQLEGIHAQTCSNEGRAKEYGYRSLLQAQTVLTHSPVTYDYYISALAIFRDYFHRNRELDKEKVCSDAIREYVKRWKTNDPRAVSEGVNELLHEKGLIPLDCE